MKLQNILTRGEGSWRRAWVVLGLAGLLIVAALAANSQSTPALAAAPSAPKAYIGLFKDNAVAVLDTGTNTVLSTISVPTGPHGLVVTPDGRWVYVSSDGDSKVSVIDTTTDKVANTIEVGKSPHGLAITPDGKWVLVADFGTSEVVFINTATNQVAGQVPVPSPHNIAISPDGTTAYVAAQKQGATGLAVLDLAKMTLVDTIPLDKTPRALNFSPDGKELYFTLAGVDAVQVLDPMGGQIKAQIPVGASPHHPLFTPDGKYALVVSQGPGELDIVAPDSNSVSETVKVGTLPHWIALAPKGTTAYVTNENSNDVSVVDVAKGTVTATIPVGNGPRKIVIQPQVPATSQSLSAASSAADFQTTISGFAFEPKITIAAGQSIVWTNKDSVPHTVTSDNGAWDSGDIASGATYKLTLDKPGTYTYHCMHHPYMTGTIVVTS